MAVTVLKYFILVIGGLTVMGLCLCPPWHIVSELPPDHPDFENRVRPVGHHSLLLSKKLSPMSFYRAALEVDKGRLLLECAGVLAVTIALFLCVHRSQRRRTTN